MIKAFTLTMIAIDLVLAPIAAVQINQAHQVIEEDEPGWDCHTMGNLICGDAQN